MDQRLYMPFLSSTHTILRDMAGLEEVRFGEPEAYAGELAGLGMAAFITFAGRIKGRFILDLPQALTLRLVNSVLDESFDEVRNPLVLATVSELANIISGDANTHLNNTYSLNLRLAPPVACTGEGLTIMAEKLHGVRVSCETPDGAFRIHIAFQGGLD